MIRFSTAMVLFAALSLLAGITLSDERIRGATLLVVGLFAFRTWRQHRRQVAEQERTEAAKLSEGEVSSRWR